MTDVSQCAKLPEPLLQAALEVRLRAYAPYSNFLVGAAILDQAGNVHVGCNVENASYGLTQCAERTAIGSAVASGARRFTTIVIVSKGGVSPCGACRQVLAEFAPDLIVWRVDVDDLLSAQSTSLRELLPWQFTLEDQRGAG